MRKLAVSAVALVTAGVIFWMSKPASPPPPVQKVAAGTNVVESTSHGRKSQNIQAVSGTNLTPAQVAVVMQRIREDLAKRGLYTDRADMIRDEDSGELLWKKIEDSRQVMFNVQGYLLEPFSPRTLDALDHVLKHSAVAAERLSAATLLYRYGRESGRIALLELLKQGGTDGLAISAAITLALNKDQAGMVDTLTLLSRLKDINPSLLHALGNWKDQAITQGLARGQELAPNHKYWAYALAYQDNPLGLPALQTALGQIKGSVDFISIRIEAATSRLGGMDAGVFQEHFEGMLKKQPQLGGQLMTVLEQAGPKVGGPELLKMLENFVPQHQQMVAEAERQAQMVAAKDPKAYHSYAKPIPFTALPGAAQFAADWELKAAVPLLEKVIVQMQKGSKTFNDLNQLLGIALYRLDPVGWRDTLLNAGLRQDHIDRIPEIAKLRPVAHDQTPQQKNLVWR